VSVRCLFPKFKIGLRYAGRSSFSRCQTICHIEWRCSRRQLSAIRCSGQGRLAIKGSGQSALSASSVYLASSHTDCRLDNCSLIAYDLLKLCIIPKLGVQSSNRVEQPRYSVNQCWWKMETQRIGSLAHQSNRRAA